MMDVDKDLKTQGNEIEKIFKTMDISCSLKSCISNELANKFEFNLRNLADFKKIKKAIEIIRICTHKDISQVESKTNHFAVEIRKDKSVLSFLEYNAKYNIDNKYSAFLGIDTDNQPIVFDLKKSIHTLIGGSTGMGKTSLVNNIIYALTSKNTADELNLYIIDIKKTLSIWEGLPHIKNEQIEDVYDALDTLEEISDIMEERIDIIREKKLSKATDDMFPHIVVVIDELADLILNSHKKDVEEEIKHIAQLGRAVNIFLIIATQNPIKEVCTSNIKANCPTRIALKTISYTNSRVILDNDKTTKYDASKLEGVGYAIMRRASDSTESKFKACFLTDNEIKEYLKENKYDN